MIASVTLNACSLPILCRSNQGSRQPYERDGSGVRGWLSEQTQTRQNETHWGEETANCTKRIISVSLAELFFCGTEPIQYLRNEANCVDKLKKEAISEHQAAFCETKPFDDRTLLLR